MAKEYQQTQPLKYTVTMDANLARVVGMPAAMLYNLLVWMSQLSIVKDYDDDGWFYLTAQQFEDATTFKPNAFTKASDKLVEAGLVEKRRMYVKYGHKESNRSTIHFRVISRNSDFQLTPKVSATHSKSDLYNIKEENIKEEKQITPGGVDLCPPEPAALGASQASPAPQAPKEMEAPFEPIGAEPKKVSVRPDKKETDANRKSYAVGKQVLEAWGFKSAKIGVPMAKLVKNWLDSGFDAEQIIEAGKMMKQSGNEYWEKATPIQMLTENAMMWYQAQGKREKTVEDYYREMAEARLKEEAKNDKSFWEAVKRKEEEDGR